LSCLMHAASNCTHLCCKISSAFFSAANTGRSLELLVACCSQLHPSMLQCLLQSCLPAVNTGRNLELLDSHGR
jgi:hypothetical protein